MAISILGGFAILAGVVLLGFVLIRKIPLLSELVPQSPLGESSREPAWKIPKVDWKGFDVRMLRFLEVVLRSLRRFFFFFLRTSEHWIRGLNTRAKKIAGENPPKFLPKFHLRIKRRQVFVEEERKLLEWLTQHPDDFDSYRRLGNLYTVTGNIRDARAAFEQALRLRPEDDEIKRHLDELAVK